MLRSPILNSSYQAHKDTTVPRKVNSLLAEPLKLLFIPSIPLPNADAANITVAFTCSALMCRLLDKSEEEIIFEIFRGVLLVPLAVVRSRGSSGVGVGASVCVGIGVDANAGAITGIAPCALHDCRGGEEGRVRIRTLDDGNGDDGIITAACVATAASAVATGTVPVPVPVPVSTFPFLIFSPIFSFSIKLVSV